VGRLVTPSVRIYDDEGDSIETGIRVSSWDPENSQSRFAYVASRGSCVGFALMNSEVPSVTCGSFNTPFFPP
jgi:hypothetical protein